VKHGLYESVLKKKKNKKERKKEETKHKICFLHVFTIHYSPPTQEVVRLRVLTSEQWCDRRCDAASPGISFPTFRMNGSPSSSMLQRSMKKAGDERDKRSK
jgi:hypothetical protein